MGEVKSSAEEMLASASNLTHLGVNRSGLATPAQVDWENCLAGDPAAAPLCGPCADKVWMGTSCCTEPGLSPLYSHMQSHPDGTLQFTAD